MSKKEEKSKKAEEAMGEEIVEQQEVTQETPQPEEPQNSSEPTVSKEDELIRLLAEQQDKHLRLMAEFDNYRKRTLKEKSDLIKTGGESVITNILPVVDDLDRALKALETAQDLAAVKEGMTLIFTKFGQFLAQSGVKEVEATSGQAFDTDKHEAITNIPAPSEELKGKVVDVIQKGYCLHDKVIRFAKVVVGE